MELVVSLIAELLQIIGNGAKIKRPMTLPTLVIDNEPADFWSTQLRFGKSYAQKK